jgi:hypothetical protein
LLRVGDRARAAEQFRLARDLGHPEAEAALREVEA